MIWKFTLFSLIIFCRRFQTHYCYPFQAQARNRNVRNVPVANLIRRSKTLSSFSGDFEYGTDNSNAHATRIYFDIGLGVDETIGRLTFNLLGSERLLPLHAENLIKLSTGEMRSLDPRLGYSNCEFNHSPQSVEGFPQYRWAHIVQGRGRNAVGRPTDRISDPDSLRACCRSIYGGVYYGLEYNDKIGDFGVLLTVPLVGANRNSSGFSIVRVGESPQEWRERLLLNSAVLGYLESGIETLHKMARQTDAPPTIISSGILSKDEGRPNNN